MNSIEEISYEALRLSVLFYLRKKGAIRRTDLPLSVSLIIDLGLTQENMIDLCEFIATTYHFEIKDSEVAGLNSFGHLLDYFNFKIQQAPEQYQRSNRIYGRSGINI